VEYYDIPAIRSIVRDAARNNYRFSALIAGIVKSVPFQMKIKKVQDAASQTAVNAAPVGRALTSAQARIANK
jgi:hypothetical protein